MKDDKVERMSANEKINLLQKQLEKSMETVTDELDVVRIDAIINELEKLRAEKNNFNMDTAFQEFKNKYYFIAKKARIEYQTIQTNLKNIRRKLIFKIASFLILGFICINTVSYAIANISIFDVIFHSNDDVLKIKTKEIQNTNIQEEVSDFDKDKEITSFKELEETYKIVVPKPTYIPNHGSLYSIEILTANEIFITYENEENDDVFYYSISFIQSENDLYIVEKTKENPELYQKNDINYYMTKNKNWCDITWRNQNQICNISGVPDIKECKKIINGLKY